MSYLERVRTALAVTLAAGRLREPRSEAPLGIDFASNDYLGLRRDPRVLAGLSGARVAGSGGSRLLGGASQEHASLERALSAWLGRERTLLFSSGYLAAIGAITTLAEAVDVAYSDALVHACAIDGLRLTKLPRHIYAHGTLPKRYGALDAALLVTETHFGMEGTSVPVGDLAASLGARDVALVDEAHAVGVFGPGGRGLAAGVRDERIIVLGTLSKAFGCAGGFVAGPADAIALMATRARTFVYDTASPPALVAAAHAALDVVRGPAGDALRDRLHANVDRVRRALAEAGIPVAPGGGPVIPIHVGDDREALALAERLAARGIVAPAIRHPTVPEGTARLRITIRADHSDSELDVLAAALSDACAQAPAAVHSA